jgi:tRNA nucleotidyltransferase (CCA-adding enzyme)
MHIPARPRQAPIVAGGLPADELAERVRQRLDLPTWPLPLHLLPPGTALVGGAVRDALLGRLALQPDLDLVVPGGAINLCRRLAGTLGGSCVVLDAARDIARLVLRGWTIDLARQEGAGLADDLLRRDYTANAIALPLAEEAQLVDPSGGLADLAAARLVAVSEANLLADPLRLLRGVRLSWELGLPLEATSQQWMRRHAASLGQVAGERVLAELDKLAALPDGQRGLIWSLEAGLLTAWGADPAATGRLRVFTLEQARACGLGPRERVWALPLARLAALLPAEALAGLRSSRQLQLRTQRLRRWWERLAGSPDLEQLPESQRLELQQELEADLPALLMVLPASVARGYLTRWRRQDDPLFHPMPPLNGDQLQRELGLSPGRELGDLIHHLTRERAFGRIPEGDPAGRAVAIDTALAWLGRRHD